MKKSRAFSFIELSIVILIIGILIAGVTQASRLVKQFNLSTARSLSKSSDVNGIKDLVLWLDATAEGSMVNAAGSVKVEDGNTVQTWNDVNPQVNPLLRFSLIQGNDSKRPTYKDSGINGLPTLFFNAASNASTGQALSTGYSSTLNPATFTLFVVTRPMEDTTANGYIVENQSGLTGFSFKVMDANVTLGIVGYNGTTSVQTFDSSVLTYGTPYVSTISTNGTAQTIYRNGASPQSSNIVESPNLSAAPFRVGCSGDGTSNCYDGYVSEIIFYSRVLKERERKAIEKYLGKKYGILVS